MASPKTKSSSRGGGATPSHARRTGPARRAVDQAEAVPAQAPDAAPSSEAPLEPPTVVAESVAPPEVDRPVRAPIVLVRTPARRTAIVAGLRTPFAQGGAALDPLSALDLGRLVITELLARTGVEPGAIDQVVFGQVVPSVPGSNVARDVAIAADLPRSVDAFGVSRACATSLQALVSVAQSIDAGLARGGIAGGTESASHAPYMVSRRLADALAAASRATSLRERLAAFRGVRPRDLVPVAAPVVEPSTGLTLAQHAEAMARDWGIASAQQHEYAHRSHARAAAAWAEGRLADDVMHVYVPPSYRSVTQDGAVRFDSAPPAAAAPGAALEKGDTEVGPATIAPATDGAAALLVMREDRAEELGLQPLGFLRSYAFAAVDPRDHLLLGPAYAMPLALERAGVTLADLDVVEMHESSAAEVLCNLEALQSTSFAHDRLGRGAALGAIDPDRLNPNGGSLAFGHPPAATGARLVLGALAELRRRGGSLALCTTSARGGLGAAVVLERAS